MGIILVTIQIHNEQLVQRLQTLAARENRPIEELLQTLLDQYTSRIDAMEAMNGMFDDDISDLSTSVRETMNTYYRKRDDSSD